MCPDIYTVRSCDGRNKPGSPRRTRIGPRCGGDSTPRHAASTDAPATAGPQRRCETRRRRNGRALALHGALSSLRSTAVFDEGGWEYSWDIRNATQGAVPGWQPLTRPPPALHGQDDSALALDEAALEGVRPVAQRLARQQQLDLRICKGRGGGEGQGEGRRRGRVAAPPLPAHPCRPRGRLRRPPARLRRAAPWAGRAGARQC